MDGLTKCTYITTVTAGNGAPAFSLTSTTWSNFQLHYLEYAHFTTNTAPGVGAAMEFLPATSATPLWMGTYASDTFPTPLALVTTQWNSLSWTIPTTMNANANIETITPSSIGNFQYYPNVPGAYKSDLILTMDSGILFEEWNRT